MIELDAIITFASWEDRFYMGFEKNLRSYSTKAVHMYYYKEYADRTADNRNKLGKLCAKKHIILKKTEIAAKSPADTWRVYEKEFSSGKWNSKNVLVDISTMPRDSIWSIFSFLEMADVSVSYIYYKPAKYGDWLSRDPEKPRLIFKHSGIAKLGYPTGLIIITGFDPDRTLQMINVFEPELILLGIQAGSQFDSNKKNLKAHRLLLKGRHKVKFFEIDAYSEDHGQSVIEREATKYLNKYNMIVSSLGPKPSAVALYKVCKRYPEVALSYAPSRDFNVEYSLGIGRKYLGKL